VPDNAAIRSGNGAGNDQQSANDGGSSVPARAQSRINVTNDGMEHINDRHLDPSVNASQFSIGESDLRSLLQDPNTISTPITREIPSADGIRYVREIDVGKAIGTDKYSNGQPTSVMTVLTDKYGNLVTAFPGKLK
jgi:filamentous hemagglutinin